MLATMPSASPQAQRSVSAPTPDDDRLCAGCSNSVSSETGGVVVAFGSSLWHVDCFKCAKCGNQVNADTNLLLLSDGSPVCANCYNCKVCKLPILDEAVMTGDDSFHAECFTCRSCKNRIDELVFAKTSQGFYCMKCHNERVARSRRHMAKQKQRERERAALGSSGGRSTTSVSDGVSRPSDSDRVNGVSIHPDVARARHASGGSSNGSSQATVPTQAVSNTSTPAEASASGSSSRDIDHRSASPAPPSVSVTVAGPSSAAASKEELRANLRTGESSTRRPSIDGPPPPPYSKTPPPANGNSDVESVRSSASYGYQATSTEPTSPSHSLSPSHDGSFNDHCAPVNNSESSAGLPLPGSRERSSSLTPREHPFETSSSGWPEERRSRSHDEDTRPSFLQPTVGGTAGLHVTKKRENRNSVNPGLQLEASKMLQFHNQRPSTSSSSPASPSGSIPASAPAGSSGRSQSPTNTFGGRDSPRVTSPLRDYFVGVDENSSGSNSNAFSPSHDESPTSPNSAPATSRPRPAAMSSAISPPISRKDLNKQFPQFPQRSDSLKDTDSPSPSVPTPGSGTRMNGLPSSPYNGKLNAPPAVLRSQRSFDERGGRLSPSPRKAEFGLDSGMRSRSSSPKPPDVPRSIESGTDTETDNGNDSDDIMLSYMDNADESAKSNSHPPTLPPKESRDRSASQPTSQPSSAGQDGEDFFSDVPGDTPSVSAVTERRSGFFIAPALPPMRFSTYGTDFNEILSNLGDSSAGKRLSMLPGSLNGVQLEDSNTVTIPGEKSDDVAMARTPTSIASTITPLVDFSSSQNTTAPSVIKPVERKASLKSKRAPPPGPITVYSGSTPSSSTTSPMSPMRKLSLRHPSKAEETSSPRSSGESRRPTTPKVFVNGVNGHHRSDSHGTSSRKQDAAELVMRRLKEALSDAQERSADYVKLDCGFVEAILMSLDQKREQVSEISSKLDNLKRSSQMMFDGLSSAQDEYKQELAARRTAEEEVSRLKIEVSGQAAKITALSGNERRRRVQEQLSKEVSENLNGLEHDLSKLKVERDMTLAEVEELTASKSSVPNGDTPGATVGRSLTMRLDNIKRQYQHELVPLTQQRETLAREIADLKEARDIFLEETAVLNARNEELAQLNSQYERRFDSGHSRDKSLPPLLTSSAQPAGQSKASFDSLRERQTQAPPIVNTTSTSSSATLIDDVPEIRQQKPNKMDQGEGHPQRPRIGLRWPGNKGSKESSFNGFPAPGESKVKKRVEHTFQQLSILRFARCDSCGDKMWGSQLRCSLCNMAVHLRCVGLVHGPCSHDESATGSDEHLAPVGPPPPSMFGRDLIEQVRDDSKKSELFVPLIVEKCINAVEALAMDYEGIYRKSGGSGQSKAITALFERGDYEAFDLTDSDAFNDISSVTSVLKNYFRMLPNPLLTFGMHEAFVGAGNIKDAQAKGQALKDLVKQLPAEHYHTLSRFILHLHRVQLQADVNLMNARNLGVIFGPTLMRSADPSREFADMAGKSLAIEYLIENAPSIFPTTS